jgi:hypothetical protein
MNFRFAAFDDGGHVGVVEVARQLHDGEISGEPEAQGDARIGDA